MKKSLLILMSVGIFSVGSICANAQSQSPMERMADDLAEIAQKDQISAYEVVARNKDKILTRVTESVKYRIHRGNHGTGKY